MARINVLAGSRRGSVLELSNASAVIGRSKECDLVLLDETVSRRHARILGRADGFYLEDLGSRNGTFLNGNAVRQPTRLAHNDCIQLFDVAVAFEESDAPPEPTADPHSAVALRRKRLAETVTQVDIAEFSSDWARANAESKLQAVLELSRGLEDAIELEHVQTQLLDALYRILIRIDRACLFQVDEPSGRLCLAALRGRDEAPDLSTTIPPLTWDLVGEALAQRQALLVSDAPAARSARDSVHTPSSLSAMCAPLMDMTQSPLGALYVECSHPENDFTREDLDVLACVALLASRAVEQATLHSDRYRAVVDHAADSIITLQDDGQIESANPAVRRQLGFEPGELLGENILRVLPEFDTSDLRGSSLTGRSNGREGIPVHREVLARRRDGSTFPASVSVGQFDLRGRHYFTATLRDITLQKQEEAHLQRVNEQLEEEVEQRTQLIRLQQDVAVISNEAESVPEAFSRVMQKVSGFLNWSVAHACLCDADEPEHFRTIDLKLPSESPARQKPGHLSYCAMPSLIVQVVLSGKPRWTPVSSESASSAESDLHLAFPVLHGRRVVGVLEFVSDHPGPPPSCQLKLLSHVGTQLGRIVERHFLQQQLVHAVWTQQRQFGQELHDTLGQELTGIGMFAQALQQRLAAQGRRESDEQAELVSMIQQAKTTARELAKSLQPVEIDAFGLPAALEELARNIKKRTGIDCQFSGVPAVPFDDDDVATHLYRIAQEAVNNASKHAQAGRILVSLTTDSKCCRMEIHDDGVGIREDAPDESGGMGLRIMKYRARSIGAEFRIANANPGTTVACELALGRI